MSPATLGNASRSAAGLTALLVVALEALSATNVCFHSWTHIHAGRPLFDLFGGTNTVLQRPPDLGADLGVYRSHSLGAGKRHLTRSRQFWEFFRMPVNLQILSDGHESLASR